MLIPGTTLIKNGSSFPPPRLFRHHVYSGGKSSHLRQHKFRNSSKDILNPLCPYSIEAETTIHYFLRCHFYNTNRSALMNELNEIDTSFSILSQNKFIGLILYDSDIFYHEPPLPPPAITF